MSVLDAFHDMPSASQPLPWLLIAGQPSAAQLTDARDAGLRAVIDVRDPMEPRSLDEDTTVRMLGMDYRNIPVVAGAVSDELMDRLLGVLREFAGTPTLLHCANANRVGGPLISYLMLDEKMAEADAVEAAMRAGLRSAEMMDWGVEYARTHAA